VEYNKEYVILHLPVIKKLTKGTLKDMQSYLKELWKFFQTVGYPSLHAGVPQRDYKIQRLLTTLGFEITGSSSGFVIFQYKG
jgi:hypothetical protein